MNVVVPFDDRERLAEEDHWVLLFIIGGLLGQYHSRGKV